MIKHRKPSGSILDGRIFVGGGTTKDFRTPTGGRNFTLGEGSEVGLLCLLPCRRSIAFGFFEAARMPVLRSLPSTVSNEDGFRTTMA
jgi:hypothetical protein